MNRSPIPPASNSRQLLADQDRANWADFYARMRWQGFDPEKRLAEQIPDHIRWREIGRKRK